jgi:RNA polymerase sigma-54 factor
MKLDFNIQINQKQGLALTAQVQQAIKLLHMTNLEIQEFVHDQFQDNPFIETDAFAEGNDNSAKASAENTDVDKSFKKVPMLNKKPKPKSPSKTNLKPGKVIYQDQLSPKPIQTLTPST